MHPVGGHPIFNQTLRFDIQDLNNRITNFPITSHGGPVMATPGNYRCYIVFSFLTNPAALNFLLSNHHGVSLDGITRSVHC